MDATSNADYVNSPRDRRADPGCRFRKEPALFHSGLAGRTLLDRQVAKFGCTGSLYQSPNFRSGTSPSNRNCPLHGFTLYSWPLISFNSQQRSGAPSSLVKSRAKYPSTKNAATARRRTSSFGAVPSQRLRLVSNPGCKSGGVGLSSPGRVTRVIRRIIPHQQVVAEFVLTLPAPSARCSLDKRWCRLYVSRITRSGFIG